ncbi:MAG: Ig-like domain-containing protein [Phycisphaerae bacterium]|nr:Ig-like domain-containing protein [Phycisphaerae bacterium]
MKIARLSLSLVVLSALAIGCGGSEDRKTRRSSESSTSAPIAALAAANAPSPGAPGQAPKIVQTTPAANAVDANPNLKEMVVTFDIPVKMNSYSLVPTEGGKIPELDGDEPISFRDNRTCVIKVKLAPNTAYAIGLNSKTRQGFKSATDETPAVPFQLRFKTGTGKPQAPADGPRVVKTDPANEAKDLEAGTFDLTIVFSEPMKKGVASLVTPPEGPRLKLLGKPTWSDARTFVVPIMLSPATNYRVGVNAGGKNQFVSAGDGTPAARFDLTFSTKGAKAPDAEVKAQPKEPAEVPSKPVVEGPKLGKVEQPPVVEKPKTPEPAPTRETTGPITLSYNYQKGDAGRVTQWNIVDVTVKTSAGQTLPVKRKIGLLSIEEVLGVERGMPVEVRKMISELIMLTTNEQTGELQAAPKLEKGVEVKVNRRTDPPTAEKVKGDVSQELMTVLAQDYFPDVKPAGPVKVGQAAAFPDETIQYLRSEFGSKPSDKADIKLTCLRIGPKNVDDARNEMFKKTGGGKPVTYVFNVAEFDIDWLQDGNLPNNIPFTLSAKGKLVFAIDAGILLSLNIEGKIAIKQFQTQDNNGQAVTVSGDGIYKYEYGYEPISWQRGVVAERGMTGLKDGAITIPLAVGGGPKKTEPKDSFDAYLEETKTSPQRSMLSQHALLKAGKAEMLKAFFTEDVRDGITQEAVEQGQKEVEKYTIDELIGQTLVDDEKGLAKIKMKNGRTLTMLRRVDGKWLSERIWFK